MKNTLIFFSLFLMLVSLRKDVDLYDIFEQKKVCEWHYTSDPSLKKLSLSAKKEKLIDLKLQGSFDDLKTIFISTKLGLIQGDLKAQMPQLEVCEFHLADAELQLNLMGEFSDTCKILIEGGEGKHKLILPTDRQVEIMTKGIHLKVVKGICKKEGLIHKKYTRFHESSKILRIEISKMRGELQLI